MNAVGGDRQQGAREVGLSLEELRAKLRRARELAHELCDRPTRVPGTCTGTRVHARARTHARTNAPAHKPPPLSQPAPLRENSCRSKAPFREDRCRSKFHSLRKPLLEPVPLSSEPLPEPVPFSRTPLPVPLSRKPRSVTIPLRQTRVLQEGDRPSGRLTEVSSRNQPAYFQRTPHDRSCFAT